MNYEGNIIKFWSFSKGSFAVLAVVAGVCHLAGCKNKNKKIATAAFD